MPGCGEDDVGGLLNGVGCNWVGVWSRAGSEFEIYSHVVTQRT